MANKQFIHAEKRWRRMYHEVVTALYAAIAVSLHREYGFEFDKIANVFALTQELWDKHAKKEIDILKVCIDETGIDFMSGVTAKEKGFDKKEADAII